MNRRKAQVGLPNAGAGSADGAEPLVLNLRSTRSGHRPSDLQSVLSLVASGRESFPSTVILTLRYQHRRPKSEHILTLHPFNPYMYIDQREGFRDHSSLCHAVVTEDIGCGDGALAEELQAAMAAEKLPLALLGSPIPILRLQGFWAYWVVCGLLLGSPITHRVAVPSHHI